MVENTLKSDSYREPVPFFVFYPIAEDGTREETNGTRYKSRSAANRAGKKSGKPFEVVEFSDISETREDTAAELVETPEPVAVAAPKPLPAYRIGSRAFEGKATSVIGVVLGAVENEPRETGATVDRIRYLLEDAEFTPRGNSTEYAKTPEKYIRGYVSYLVARGYLERV